MNIANNVESVSIGSSGSSQVLKSIPNPGPVHIVKLSEYKDAALSLATAFEKDDVSRYFIDTPDRHHWSAADKWKLHLSIFEYIVFAHGLQGLILSAGPVYSCVALWMPPGHGIDGFCTIVRSGMWRLKYKLSVEGKERFFDEFLPLLHDAKAEVLGPRSDDSWVLNYIGTKPAARGKGYARQCIEFVTRMADAQSRACYLESSNDINPAIYAKLGFETKTKIHLMREHVPIELDCMVREPRKAEIIRNSAEGNQIENGTCEKG